MNQTIVPNDLLTEIGLDNLPLEEQATILSEMGDAIMSAIMVRVVPMLDDAAKKELDTMLGGELEPAQLQAFLSAKIPTFQAIVDEEVTTFKTEASAFYKAISPDAA